MIANEKNKVGVNSCMQQKNYIVLFFRYFYALPTHIIASAWNKNNHTILH